MANSFQGTVADDREILPGVARRQVHSALHAVIGGEGL